MSDRVGRGANRPATQKDIGAPDTIRTCDLCLRRANANQPCCPPPTEIEGLGQIAGVSHEPSSAVREMSGYGMTAHGANRTFKPGTATELASRLCGRAS